MTKTLEPVEPTFQALKVTPPRAVDTVRQFFLPINPTEQASTDQASVQQKQEQPTSAVISPHQPDSHFNLGVNMETDLTYALDVKTY